MQGIRASDRIIPIFFESLLIYLALLPPCNYFQEEEEPQDD